MLIHDDRRAGARRLSRWVTRRFRTPLTSVPASEVPDLDALGLTPADVAGTLVWVDIFGGIDRGHRAAGRALTATSGSWVVLGWLLLVRPTSWAGAAAFPLVLRAADRRRPVGARTS